MHKLNPTRICDHWILFFLKLTFSHIFCPARSQIRWITPRFLCHYDRWRQKCDFPHDHTKTWTSVPLCFINLSHGTEPTFYKAPLPSLHCSALWDAKCLTLPERGGPLPCLWSQWRQMTGHTYITHMHEMASMPLERLLSIHVMLAFLTSPRACNGWRSESCL